MTKPTKSKGLLFFAHGKEYHELARNARWYATHHLKVPASLVTSDAEYSYPLGMWDEIIRVERPPANTSPHGITEWLNKDRLRAFELSPYEETLVLDVDYMVHTGYLRSIFDVRYPWLLAAEQWDAFSGEQIGERFVGKTKIPMRFATILYFQRSTAAEEFFELANHVADNWQFYAEWMGFDSRHYRNDIAFTIADWMLGGKMIGQPKWPMPILCITNPVVVTEQSSNRTKVTNILDMIKDTTAMRVIHSDLHWICKKPLLNYMHDMPTWETE